VDVIGGRILATALAAAILGDPANAAIKASARSQALAYFEKQADATANTLFAYAHSASSSTDPYADRAANAERIESFFTYGLPRREQHGARRRPMVVPKGAEVLLETRLPYLTPDQRREVLRTTAIPSGHALLDGPELWGRINLFAAADGFGVFADDVRVVMDAASGGFHAADAWRNAIGGCGGLTKAGTGALTLSGDNTYTGGVRVDDGVLVAAGSRALGDGDVRVSGGALRLASPEGVRTGGCYVQESGVLEAVATTADRDEPMLHIAGPAWLGENSALKIVLGPRRTARSGAEIRVLTSHGLHGTFGSVTTDIPGLRAEPRYSSAGLTVRLHSDR
jgi:autotransporter-associated beta strand protein